MCNGIRAAPHLGRIQSHICSDTVRFACGKSTAMSSEPFVEGIVFRPALGAISSLRPTQNPLESVARIAVRHSKAAHLAAFVAHVDGTDVGEHVLCQWSWMRGFPNPLAQEAIWP